MEVQEDNYNRILFLDDFRLPIHSFLYEKKTIYLKTHWKIVRNYDEFVKALNKSLNWDLISFDHDLADEHYTPSEYWENYELSKKYQEEQIYKEKTGLDCAKYMCEIYKKKNKKILKILVHSQNPVGKDNIKKYIENYIKNEEK